MGDVPSRNGLDPLSLASYDPENNRFETPESVSRRRLAAVYPCDTSRIACSSKVHWSKLKVRFLTDSPSAPPTFLWS